MLRDDIDSRGGLEEECDHFLDILESADDRVRRISELSEWI